MRKIYTLAAAAGLGLFSSCLDAGAQGTEELFLISRQNFGISSARSAGMGGAFTSLGADAVTLSLNPAGIAMYRYSEVSISAGVRIGNSSTDYSGTWGTTSANNNITKANISSAAVVYTGRNYAIGFGMNRLADFNSHMQIQGYDEAFSIADMFAEQLYGIAPGNLAGVNSNGQITYDAFYRYSPALWGAILGYQTEAVDPVSGTDPQQYTTAGLISDGAMVSPWLRRRTTGAINEYTISGGYNWNDILYVGASLGIQDIYYTRHDTHNELFPLDNVGLDELNYNQNLRLSGTGVNLKIGATVRPTSWLRIALAYHSPTWVSMEEQYDADMYTYDFRYPNDEVYRETPFFRQDYDLRSPSRLMAGISATIGTYAIISFDYEHAWYQNMKYTSDGFEDVNYEVGQTYKGGNIIRAGIEFQPITSFFLRGGYSFSSSVYQDSYFKKAGEYRQFSVGAGYRRGPINIDLAYVNGSTHRLPYKPFYYQADDGYEVTTNGTVYTKEQNHHIILTMAFKF